MAVTVALLPGPSADEAVEDFCEDVCDVCDGEPAVRDAGMTLERVLDGTSDVAEVTAACSEVKAAELVVRDASDPRVSLLDPGTVKVSVSSMPLAVSTGADGVPGCPVSDVFAEAGEPVNEGSREVIELCAVVVSSPVAVEVDSVLCVPAPVGENAGICEVVDSSTGTTETASSVLLGPTAEDACCPKSVTAGALVELNVVSEEETPSAVIDASLVVEAVRLVLVYS